MVMAWGLGTPGIFNAQMEDIFSKTQMEIWRWLIRKHLKSLSRQLQNSTNFNANEAQWVLNSFSHVWLWDTMNCGLWGSSLHGILQARILSGLPCPPPGDLPDPGIKPRSPALQVDSLPAEPPRTGTPFSGCFWGASILFFVEAIPYCHTTPGVGDGQGGLACCDSWGRKESDTTERLIWSDTILRSHLCVRVQSSAPLPTLAFCCGGGCCFANSHPNKCETVSHCGSV